MTVTLSRHVHLHRAPPRGDEVITTIITLGPRPQLTLSKMKKQNKTNKKHLTITVSRRLGFCLSFLPVFNFTLSLYCHEDLWYGYSDK